MTLIRVTLPPVEPISLLEARDHLRVDEAEDDGRINRNIRSATERLDGPGGLLGRALVTQTWDYSIDAFPYEIELPLPPCQSVGSISYIDDNGDGQTLSTDDYQAYGLGDQIPARIRPAFGKSWPSTRHVPDAVTVRFTAGYGDAPDDVPEPIRQAILVHVAQMFDYRLGFVDEQRSAHMDAPLDYYDLINPYRLWGL